MAKKKTILVVDDEKDVLDTIKLVLEKYGYNVVAATNYQEVLEITNNIPIDLMLLDIMLPDVDGTAILQITRGNKFIEKPFPIIYISALSKSKVDLKGSDGFIQKPFSNEELIRYIKKFLK